MNKEITIVDQGRGPQLSTSRITVQDLFPFLQQHYTPEQIMEIMPVLTADAIRVVEEYIKENLDAVMELDRRICERNAAHRKSPEIEEAEYKLQLMRLANARQVIQQGEQKLNGDQAPCG
jgi:hypothetical protein